MVSNMYLDTLTTQLNKYIISLHDGIHVLTASLTILEQASPQGVGPNTHSQTHTYR